MQWGLPRSCQTSKCHSTADTAFPKSPLKHFLIKLLLQARSNHVFHLYSVTLVSWVLVNSEETPPARVRPCPETVDYSSGSSTFKGKPPHPEPARPTASFVSDANQTNRIRACIPTASFTRLLNSRPLSPCPNHPRTSYQAPRDSPHAPEPAGTPRTSQPEARSPCLTRFYPSESALKTHNSPLAPLL